LKVILTGATIGLLAACGGAVDSGDASTQASQGINEERLLNAAGEPHNWLTHGGTFSETRFSALDAINLETIDQLDLAWAAPLGSYRGVEATPIIVDGVMYTTGSWSEVLALNAATGEILWRYDPEVPRSKGAHACCDVVNRGVAVYNDKVIFGSLDGRLIALDSKSGEQIWETRTVPLEEPYTITGAPRIVKGKVIIGNGGGEFGVRGFVAAYDAETGEQAWKFYTVPGNPDDGFENEAIEMAAETWTGEWWKLGGGGTVW
ncbi:PQQ-binding-like beta-propeller repeat protein, partial [Hyphomonas sp. UBA3601]